MASLLAELQHDAADELLNIDGKLLLQVLFELEKVDVLGCETGPELVSWITRNPRKVTTVIFYSGDLIWIVSTGKDAHALVCGNYQIIRDYIEKNPLTPVEIKIRMLGLVDNIIHHDKQRQSN